MSDETLDEAVEATETAMFVSPTARSLRLRLFSKKVNFVNGQLALTDPCEIDEMLRLIREVPAVSRYVSYVDAAAAEVVSRKFQRRQAAVAGPYSSADMKKVSQEFLDERDAAIGQQAVDPVKYAEMQALIQKDDLTLTERAVLETEPLADDGFIADPVLQPATVAVVEDTLISAPAEPAMPGLKIAVKAESAD